MLVLDANILIRAVLGSRVLLLLRKYSERVVFLAPDVAFHDAQEHLPGILERRRIALNPAMTILDLLTSIIEAVEPDIYSPWESEARARLQQRDEDDWPVLACALALGCPIWTEDSDFFGCGVATWTTDRVEIYLENVTC